jgi:hypothetical protein
MDWSANYGLQRCCRLNLGDANHTGCPLVKDSVRKRTASPITDEEKLWQKGDIEALNKSIEKKRDIPVPQLLSYCCAYNGRVEND